MIKKEFKDIVPGVALKLLIAAIINTVFIIIIGLNNDNSTSLQLFGKAFAILMPVVFVWIAYGLGLSAFFSEYKDDSFEYIFSSPITKRELFFYKLIPRIAILFIIALSVLIFNFMFLEPLDVLYVVFAKPHIFLSTGILVFFCSFFLSIFSWKNLKTIVWVIYFFPMLCLGLIIIQLNKHFNILKEKLSPIFAFNISLFIIAVILGLAFFIVFKKLDLKSEKIHKNKFGIYAGIPLILIVVIAVTFSIIDKS